MAALSFKASTVLDRSSEALTESPDLAIYVATFVVINLIGCVFVCRCLSYRRGREDEGYQKTLLSSPGFDGVEEGGFDEGGSKILPVKVTNMLHSGLQRRLEIEVQGGDVTIEAVKEAIHAALLPWIGQNILRYSGFRIMYVDTEGDLVLTTPFTRLRDLTNSGAVQVVINTTDELPP